MRIQHNIMAMTAYRNYTNNVSAMKANLEKLSSGYKINRAGDDAAGLAISEKMRAQITGLETAQKNAKDGISLVQTAEGALTEVHDMLNRMVELATQSANGTYDNDTDRAQLQKEMDQLRDEINRIADSSNFNGIKLLDGSMDSSLAEVTASASAEAGTIGALPGVGDILGTDTVLHKGSDAVAPTKFSVDLHNVEFSNTDGAEMTLALGDDIKITLSGDGTGTMDAEAIAKAIAGATSSSTTVAGDGTAAGITFGDTAGTVTINGENFTVSSSGTRLTFEQVDKTTDWLEAPTTVDITGKISDAAKTAGYVYSAGTAETVTADVTGLSGKNGLTTDEAAALDSITVGGLTVSLSLSAGDDIAAVATKIQTALNAAVSQENTDRETAATANSNADWSKLGSFTVAANADGDGFDISWTETVQEWGGTTYADAAAGAQNKSDDTQTFSASGISNADLTTLKGATIGVDGETVAHSEISNLNAGDSWDDVIAAVEADITDALDTVSSTAKTAADTANDASVAANPAEEPTATYTKYSGVTVAMNKNGDGLDISAKKAEMSPTEPDENATIVSGDWNVSTTVLNSGADASGNRLASTYFTATADMFSEGSQIRIGEETYTIGKDVKVDDLDLTKDADLTTAVERLTVAAKANKVYTVGHDGTRVSVTENPEYTKADGSQEYDLTQLSEVERSLGFASASSAKGTGLTLQIGDTADSYNQLSVDIKDCHTTSLGIADISIATQEDAQAAVDAIKSAINYVSDVRGTLGATQNRLDHTINNLSVMTENIQDAESTIRDVDVAEEMMEYTKNNILIQASQAMLAQANQVPQGVLQLLQ